MTIPLILTTEKVDRKGNVISHGEFLIDASTMKPGELKIVENTFEFQHPECYWGGFKDTESREQAYSVAVEGILSVLKKDFPNAYTRRRDHHGHDSLYGEYVDWITQFCNPGRFGKILPHKLSTLYLGMISADIICHNPSLKLTLDEIYKNRESNFLRGIPFCSNSEVYTDY